jgi:hypothetical protein
VSEKHVRMPWGAVTIGMFLAPEKNRGKPRQARTADYDTDAGGATACLPSVMSAVISTVRLRNAYFANRSGHRLSQIQPTAAPRLPR